MDSLKQYIAERKAYFWYMPEAEKENISESLLVYGYTMTITRRVEEQMNLIVNDVKITFFEYPFEITAPDKIDTFAKTPTLLDLAAMKAYALGRRSKWKDYVDLYFITKDYYSLETIIHRAEEIFGDMFSDKLFRSQLCYFADVDYTEAVDYLIPHPPTDEEIKTYLTNLSTLYIQ